MATKTMTMTPADILKFQNDLIRTGQCLPIGRLSRIAIGPHGNYKPPVGDPIIEKYGRMIDLRGNFLPIAQTKDRSMVLITAPLIDRQGRVALPDLPDPTWTPEQWSKEEVEDSTLRDPGKDQPRMVPQRLEDRTSEKLIGSNFLVFQPVLRITYQLELDKKLQPIENRISFRPDPSTNPPTFCAFLVDQVNGECHFYGGVPMYEGDARG